ncbi:hypothetical protein, partial [Hyphomonas atlantica]|uniref:hypothetical protein n=1 Tax=Hyphomonas atlantica TaxID=1280948 RepID=UPI0023F2E815
FSADPSGPDFCLIFAPLAGYDVPEILLKQFGRSVSWSLTGNIPSNIPSNLFGTDKARLNILHLLKKTL